MTFKPSVLCKHTVYTHILYNIWPKVCGHLPSRPYVFLSQSVATKLEAHSGIGCLSMYAVALQLFFTGTKNPKDILADITLQLHFITLQSVFSRHLYPETYIFFLIFI